MKNFLPLLTLCLATAFATQSSAQQSGAPAETMAEAPAGAFRDMTPEERQAARERFEQIPEEQRQAARERLKNMTPEQRQQMRERFNQMSPEERAQMHERLQQHQAQ